MVRTTILAIFLSPNQATYVVQDGTPVVLNRLAHALTFSCIGTSILDTPKQIISELLHGPEVHVITKARLDVQGYEKNLMALVQGEYFVFKIQSCLLVSEEALLLSSLGMVIVVSIEPVFPAAAIEHD